MGNSIPEQYNSKLAWPKCCQDQHRAQSFFSFSPSPDQTKATEQYINSSIVPDFMPCRNCARDLLRRYNDNQRKTIQDCVDFEQIPKEYIQSIFSSDAETLSITHLKAKHLVMIGLTCGAPDFVNNIMKSAINGKRLFPL